MLDTYPARCGYFWMRKKWESHWKPVELVALGGWRVFQIGDERGFDADFEDFIWGPECGGQPHTPQPGGKETIT